MNVALARVPIEPMEADRLREWYAEPHDREDEVVETLQHEGVYTESASIRESDGVEYLHVYMKGKDAMAASAAGDEGANDIDGASRRPRYLPYRGAGGTRDDRALSEPRAAVSTCHWGFVGEYGA